MTMILLSETKTFVNCNAWICSTHYRYTFRIPHKLQKYAKVETEDTYENLLRRKFEQTVGVPKWAKEHKYGQSSADNDTDELMVG